MQHAGEVAKIAAVSVVIFAVGMFVYNNVATVRSVLGPLAVAP